MKKSNIIFLVLFLIILINVIYIAYNSNNKPVQEELSGLRISYLDVGQADSILIQTKNNNILVDAGNVYDGDLLVKYLKSIGISKFSYVIGTHAHEDHIGGMADVINSFDIDKFYMPNVITTTMCFEDMLDALLEKQIKFETPEIDSIINIDDAVIKILYVGDDSENLNNSSIVFKLIYGNNTFLFTGDATTKVEKEIIDKDIKADVLKVGHHGSKTSSSDKFIDIVDPKYAIISVGKDNKYNLPSKKIIDRLSKKNITIYQTSEDGTIVVNSNGIDIDISKIDVHLDGGS